MSVNMNINGAIFAFPSDGEENWGDVVTNWANAVSTGLLQKAGGNFTLTSEINFGDNHGLKSKYFKFISGSVADNKTINLKAPSTAVASSYELVLPVSIGSQFSVLKYGLSGQLEHGKIVNSNVADDAGIVTSKLSALSTEKVVQTNSSGFMEASSITNTELSRLSGIGSNVQSQLDSLDGRLDTAEPIISSLASEITTTVKLTGDQTITGRKTFNGIIDANKGVGSSPITISALDINFSTGNVFIKTLSANSTFTFSNALDGQTIYVLLTNTASNYTVSFPASVKWAGNSTPTMTIGAKQDLFSFTKIGSNYYGSVIQDFTP